MNLIFFEAKIYILGLRTGQIDKAVMKLERLSEVKKTEEQAVKRKETKREAKIKRRYEEMALLYKERE